MSEPDENVDSVDVSDPVSPEAEQSTRVSATPQSRDSVSSEPEVSDSPEPQHSPQTAATVALEESVSPAPEVSDSPEPEVSPEPDPEVSAGLSGSV